MAYRELFTPRLGSSAGNAKRRRRVGREAIVIDLVGQWPWSAEPLCGSVPHKSINNRVASSLGRLENIYLFSFAREPRPSTRTLPLIFKAKDETIEANK